VIAAWQFGTSDIAIVCSTVVVVGVLVYRIFRREPSTRIVRIGLFIERKPFEKED